MAGLLHFFMLPEAKSAHQSMLGDRRFLVLQYLVFQRTPNVEFKLLDRFLKKQWQASDRSPEFGETIALIYGLEDQPEAMDKVLSELEGEYDRRTLDFALGLGEELPEQWRDDLDSDWTSAKISALVFQKIGDDRGYAEALIKLRDYESIAQRWQSAYSLFSLLRILGIGLIVSMILSRRYYKMRGEPFFKLRSIPLPKDALFSFCGYFLAGFLLIGLVGQAVLGQQPIWLQTVIVYLLQVSLGTYLVKKCLFPNSDRVILETLGLANLKMRFFNLFQILGGVTILVACSQFALDLMSLLPWPFEDIDMSQPYREIMKDPGASAMFLLVACIIAPLFEEVLFRGIIFRALLDSYKPWVAFVVSSGLFAILHPLPLWPAIFAVGLGLSLIYYRTGNILINIWAHALWNGTALVLTLLGIQG